MSGVIATYLLHDKKQDIEKKAESIALGLTVGTWTDLPQLEQEQLRVHKGQVISVEYVASNKAVNLYFSESRTVAKVKIFYPSVNMENSLPSILTTVFGKLSLDGEIKLIDLELTSDVQQAFPGPKFGIDGIREKLNVYDRPLLMSIFKGVIGRDVSYIKEHLALQAYGGVDIVKDDEILFESEACSFKDRIITGKEVLQDVYEKTGHRTLYAVNLTGKTFNLKQKAKQAVELGADILLFNVFAYGLDVLQGLVEDKDITIPIMAHPAVSGAMTSSSIYGIASPLLLGKCVRLAGADFSLFPSPYGTVSMDKEDALYLADSLTSPSIHKKCWPVPSAGIHPGLTSLLYRDFGLDSVINAGGGIHGHKGGTIAGGTAFRQAIDAAVANIPLVEAAQQHEELDTALQQWGYVE